MGEGRNRPGFLESWSVLVIKLGNQLPTGGSDKLRRFLARSDEQGSLRVELGGQAKQIAVLAFRRTGPRALDSKGEL